MKSIFHTIDEAGGLRVVAASGTETVAAMDVKEWESGFFDRKVGMLHVYRTPLEKMTENDRGRVVDAVISFALNNRFVLVELHLGIKCVWLVPQLEAAGFRLVDTRITFLTLYNNKEIVGHSPEVGRVRLASRSDMEDILRLTSEGFTHNAAFLSRFKNRAFFTPEESEEYFDAWITNNIDDEDSLFAVWEVESRIVGYYIYKRVGKHEGKTIYKGLLSTVIPRYRGHRFLLFMQNFLYQCFPETSFYLDNTTQLNNYPVIKNHVNSHKKLDRIELTFYWTPDTNPAYSNGLQ